MEARYLTVKNWGELQHYSRRNPLWIKLYRKLLEDNSFLALSEIEQWQLVRIWLVASRADVMTKDDKGRDVPLLSFSEPAIRRAIGSLKKVPLEKFIRCGWLVPLSPEEADLASPIAAKDTPAGFTPEWRALRLEVLERDDFTCRYCGVRREHDKVFAGPGKEKSAMTVDHVVPRSLGGTDELANLVSACVDCNLKKHGKDASEILDGVYHGASTVLEEVVGQKLDVALQRNRETEVNPNGFTNIVETWLANAPPLIQHRESIHGSTKAKRAVSKGIDAYGLEDAAKAVANYAHVLASSTHYFKHKWTLPEFFTRGIHKFVDEAEPLTNYVATGRPGKDRGMTFQEILGTKDGGTDEPRALPFRSVA